MQKMSMVRNRMQKNVPLVKQNAMKFYEDRELIRRERKDGGEVEERGLKRED